MVSDGERRVEDDWGRLEPGRELAVRLAPGRVLDLGVLFGLAEPLIRAVPDFAVLALAVLALAVPDLAVLALAMLALAVLDLVVRALAVTALVVPDLTGRALAGLDDLVAGRRAEPDRLAEEAGRRAEDRVELDRLAEEAGRSGMADAAGLAADIDFAAVVRALAAVVMALVAWFIDCMAVDMVLAEVVARVAAAVILVAAEVTLVAADETVLAAVAVVGRALVERLREAVLRDADERDAVVRADLAAVRVGLAAVPRVDD
jgi:hypothetical protein